MSTAIQQQQQEQHLFEVHVAKQTFKFHAAHFVAYDGFRERLHGHNYQVSVRLIGSHTIMNDGYLIDFGDIKGVMKKICKELNEHFICPTLSDVIKISHEDDMNITLRCQDGAFFSFPKSDCVMLPIVHSTVEELSIYLYGRVLRDIGITALTSRGIHTMEINVAEAVGQDASFRYKIPQDLCQLKDVPSFIKANNVVAKPCLRIVDTEEKETTTDTESCKKKENECECNCSAKLSSQLQKLSEAIMKLDILPSDTLQELKETFKQ